MVTSSSTFDVHVRLHRCESCGAPLEVPLEDGQVACSYCGATHVIERRPTEARSPRPPAADGETSIGVAEDLRSPLHPDVVKAFRREARTRVKTLKDVEAWWQERRAGFVAGDPTSEAWLFFVGCRLATAYAANNDPKRQRAALESVLDTVRGPELRDLARLRIARDAAWAGELENASAWIARCSSGSDVLDLDSQRRVAEAVVALKREDWTRVLERLGERAGRVTFVAWLSPQASVLRAHALEKTNRQELAYRDLWAGQWHDRGTFEVLEYEAEKHGIAVATLARVRRWRARARIVVALALIAAAWAVVTWLRR